jgi:hypothetical protein
MIHAPRILILAASLLGAGCLPNVQKTQAEAEQKMFDDIDDRKARLKAQGTLSPQEYAALAQKMGWTNKDARGIPPPPTTEELEKSVKGARAAP